jgi:hypothetical protein
MDETESFDPFATLGGSIFHILFPFPQISQVNVPLNTPQETSLHPGIEKLTEVQGHMGQYPPHDPMDVEEDATSTHSTSSVWEKVVTLLQYPQKICEILELCLEHT